MIGFVIIVALLVAAFLSFRGIGGLSSMSTSGPTPELPVLPVSPDMVQPNSKIHATASQIYNLAVQAGFSGLDAVIATAVALAESGGDMTAYNPETAANTPEGLGSYGLWQIYAKVHTDVSPAHLLYDPVTNAAEAFKVYEESASSFNPWSTYKNGAYNAHLDTAASVAQDPTMISDGSEES